ncbi:MAG: glutamate--tRNA ligase [Peptostreptococcaceae bacterium]|nr:glutamate--tRNA ligase [Peptostreptococcaceae bacterium]
MNVVRFAPSPTGFVHIGSLRTALYNYLYAKKTGGKYLLRVEDTDQTRLVDGALEGMLEAMKWAGIDHTEGVMIDDAGHVCQKGEHGPYIQSERLPIYQKYMEELIDKGYAYPCFCTKERLDHVREEQKSKGENFKYDGHCRSLSKEEIDERMKNNEPFVYRLKLPENTDITFEDVVRGTVTINTEDMDDQVLMKTDGFPTYHFAVVVDDHLMKVTHIIRGEEWLPSTPKHAFLYDAFGWEAPVFVHLPNILNSDKKKLSKRQGDVAVEDFKKKGYLKEALVNYVALLGWSPEDNQEIFSMEELEQAFSLEKVSKSGGVFDVQKLNWMNNQYIKAHDLDDLTRLCIPYVVEAGQMTEQEASEKFEWMKLAVETVRESMDYLSVFPEKIAMFLEEYPEKIDEDAQEFMKNDHMKDLALYLENKLQSCKEDLSPDDIKSLLKEIQTEHGIKGKNLFMGSRVLLTGHMHGSDINNMLSLIGRDALLQRLTQAKKFL